MTITQFKKIKSQIDKVLAKAEDEALAEGMLITDPNFQELILKVKSRLLEDFALTLEEYDKLEEELETTRELEEDEVIKLGERTKEFSEARKKEFKEKTDEIMTDFGNELQILSNKLGQEIESTKKSALTRKDILNTILPLIPKIPEHGDIDHPKILEQLGVLNKKIDGLKKQVKDDTLKEDLFKLQDEFTGLYDKVRNIKVPTDYVPTSVLEPSIKDIMGPELNRILRSFQSQVYMVDHAVKERVIRDGFYKLTVSATEPTNPEVNDLWVNIS